MLTDHCPTQNECITSHLLLGSDWSSAFFKTKTILTIDLKYSAGSIIETINLVIGSIENITTSKRINFFIK